MENRCSLCEKWINSDEDLEMNCKICGKKTDILYYGFMLLGEEYEFEDTERCKKCTDQIKHKTLIENEAKHKGKDWVLIFKLYKKLYLETDKEKSNILLKKIEKLQLGGKKHG